MNKHEFMEELRKLLVDAGRKIVTHGVTTVLLVLAVGGLVWALVWLKGDFERKMAEAKIEFDTRLTGLEKQLAECHAQRANDLYALARLETRLELLTSSKRR